MESEIKDINIPIPMGQVYKTHILNEMGDVDRVFVFCANFYTSEHLSTIFSETELIHYKENDVNIVFSARLIHKDDTIHEIKQKIVAELIDFQMNHDKSKYNISVDELSTLLKVNWSIIYRHIRALKSRGTLLCA